MTKKVTKSDQKVTKKAKSDQKVVKKWPKRDHKVVKTSETSLGAQIDIYRLKEDKKLQLFSPIYFWVLRQEIARPPPWKNWPPGGSKTTIFHRAWWTRRMEAILEPWSMWMWSRKNVGLSWKMTPWDPHIPWPPFSRGSKFQNAQRGDSSLGRAGKFYLVDAVDGQARKKLFRH